MSELNFKDLELKVPDEVTKITFNGKEIEIKKYLPINQRYNIVMIALQKANEDGIYNQIKLDEYFHLNLVYSYTNIEFSDEDLEDEDTLYDILNSSGLLNIILQNINEDQYKEMIDYTEDIIKIKQSYESSFAGILKLFIDSVAVNSEKIQQIVDNFDKEKFQEVLEFAKAANGGRDI